MKNKNTAILVLAAGIGKRMNSHLPKVLHRVGGVPIIKRTINTITKLELGQIIAVANPQNLNLLQEALGNDITYVIQKEPTGTAGAVKIGAAHLFADIKTIGVMYGDDSAFYKPETISDVLSLHENNKSEITFVTLTLEDPKGLGRIVRRDNEIVAIVEEKDADESTKKICEVNDGLYFFKKDFLTESIRQVEKSKATGEYYLTDLVKLAIANGKKIETYNLKNNNEWHGINTQEELLLANKKMLKNIHVMGISGAGAAAISGIAKEMGFKITGCDTNGVSDYSKNLNIKIEKGHSKSHIKNVDLLITSPAISKLNSNNEELIYAKSQKIPTETWQEFQGEVLEQNKFVIAVAGAYGKSTTTAMISQVLIDADLDPTCEVGASVVGWDSNFKVGNSKYYVCEADEYNNNFLNYYPDIAVILNTSWDHPDFFKSKKEVENSFIKFIKNIKQNGTLVVPDFINLENITNLKRPDIKLVKFKKDLDVNLYLIGDFRKENASAAFAVGQLLNISKNKITKSLEAFSGTKRRLEFKGEVKNIAVFDDYAVQPYTITTTANALWKKFPNKKITLVLEPHTFSRIEKFQEEFINALKSLKVNEVLITDVYKARESGDETKLSKKLATSVGKNVKYTGSLENTVSYIKENANSFEVILSMGAGNINKLYDLLKAKL